MAVTAFACALPALAQDGVPSTLLFEPVLIDVVDRGSADTMYTVRELTTVPRADEPVELQTWLARRRPAPMLDADSLAANIAAHEQSILEHESRGGAFAAGLDEELAALGSLLQQSGDYARAQQVFERALHINRVNEGLFNSGQIPIIERTIQNHLARGDLVAADAQQDYMLYVQRKNHEGRSIDLLPALTRYAEWNLFAFGARVAPPPPVSDEEDEAVAPPPAPSTSAADSIDFRAGRLMVAHDAYRSLIAIVANNFGLTDNRLLNFERQLALTNYLYIATFGLQAEYSALPYSAYGSFGGFEPTRLPLGFRQGRDALERRITYLGERDDTTVTDRAKARLDLADWMLMFSKRVGAIEVYADAWKEMLATGAPANEVDTLFNPAYPTEVPTYIDHPFTRSSLGLPDDLALKHKGYIDVQFKLSRFGVASGLEVLSKTETATPALETSLLRDLRRAQFRPRIVDGSVRDNETMQVRFYFTY
jgi:tetratricopeptide (TPR) repeat protein